MRPATTPATLLLGLTLCFVVPPNHAFAAESTSLRTKPGKTVEYIEPSEQTGSSLAVVVGDVPLVHTAQLLPLDPGGSLIGRDDAARQADRLVSDLGAVLTAAHSSLAQAVKLNVYLSRTEDVPAVQKIFSKTFGASGPAVSFVITDLPVPGALVALDAVAAATDEGELTRATRFTAPGVQNQKGSHHAGVLPRSPRVYVSGMADTNSLIPATRKTLEKLVSTIDHLGLGKSDIVQLKAFLQPMSNVAAVRDEIVSFFESNAPPLVFVEWISSNPPIEIELIAAGKGDFSKEPDSVTFITPPGTVASKVFSRVARVNHGKLIYSAGLYGTKSQNAGAEVREIFHSLGGILQKTGSDFEHLVKATYYVSTDEVSSKLNDLRPEFYNPARPPAASKAKVKHVGLAEKSVTLDMIGVTK
jgi:enamine deaminase RidA (YjgF/YER057c/UK114 family)